MRRKGSGDRWDRRTWQGEHTDRLRATAAFCVENGLDAGWDRRSPVVFADFIASAPPSAALDELREDLRRATRDPRRLNAEVKALLSRHGFLHKSDNKHSRMEPGAGYAGLDPVTLPKTPGEHRGLGNQRSQIEGNLGITRLKQKS